MAAEKITQVSPKTETVDGCPVCKNQKTSFFFSSTDRLHGVSGEFSYHKCDACQSVFQNPMVVPDDLRLCYPSDYFPYNLRREIPDVDFDNLPTGNFRFYLRKAIVENIKGIPASGLKALVGKLLAKSYRLRERAFYGLVMDECIPKGAGKHYALDLGCGSGWLMEKLTKVGWETEGLEWNEKAAQLARDVTGSNVWTGDFQTTNLPKGKYDLIILNHVFEHFSDPKVVLMRLHELLAVGGKAIVLYPNPHSLGSRWYGVDWFPWEVPRHLILPTPKAVRSLAKQVGFRTRKVKTRAYYPEVHWTWSKAYQRGLKTDEFKGELGPGEKIGVLCEKFFAKLGFETGWEIVAVLGK